jgi:hypothetical protein
MYTTSMELDTTQQILVIVLATALAVLLIVAIIAIVLVIRLLQTLRIITAKAEKVVESAEAAASILKNASGPATILNLVRGVVKLVHKK